MRKLAGQLFPDSGSEQAAFLDALTGGKRKKQSAVIWTGPKRSEDPDLDCLPEAEIPDWLPDEVDFLRDGSEPGKSGSYESGDLYPVDVSSIFTASAILAAGNSRRVLDMCAARREGNHCLRLPFSNRICFSPMRSSENGSGSCVTT